MRLVARVSSRRAIVLGLVVVVASGAIGLMLARAPRSAPPHRTAAQQSLSAPLGSASLPPPASGFAIPRPVGLSDPTAETRWAPVIRETVARREPTLAAGVVERVLTRTPEDTVNLIVATAEVTRNGVTWVRALLSSASSRGAQGWLPRGSLGGWTFVDTRVVVDRRRLRLTLFRGRHAIFQAPVGIGTTSNPTPGGTFYVRDRLTSFASPVYGPLAFGTSARAPYLTDWPDGGYIGIHGTDEPQLIPGRISHGCIRLTNSAILRLGRLMPVGTLVTIK